MSRKYKEYKETTMAVSGIKSNEFCVEFPVFFVCKVSHIPLHFHSGWFISCRFKIELSLSKKNMNATSLNTHKSHADTYYTVRKWILSYFNPRKIFTGWPSLWFCDLFIRFTMCQSLWFLWFVYSIYGMPVTLVAVICLLYVFTGCQSLWFLWFLYSIYSVQVILVSMLLYFIYEVGHFGFYNLFILWSQSTVPTNCLQDLDLLDIQFPVLKAYGAL